MKKHSVLLMALLLGLASGTTQAQFGGGPPGGLPNINLSGPLTKLFGTNSAFCAAVEIQAHDVSGGGQVVVPSQVSYLEGKTRVEIDLSQVKGTKLPAQTGAQLKAFGMAEMTLISRPDTKTSYIVYPGLQSFVEQPQKAQEVAVQNAAYKTESTDLGKETFEGRDCARKKVILTDDKGQKFEYLVTTTADSRGFPVKIEAPQEGKACTAEPKTQTTRTSSLRL